MRRGVLRGHQDGVDVCDRTLVIAGQIADDLGPSHEPCGDADQLRGARDANPVVGALPAPVDRRDPMRLPLFGLAPGTLPRSRELGLPSARKRLAMPVDMPVAG